MKTVVFLMLSLSILCKHLPALAQQSDPSSKNKWSHDIEAWLYLIPDGTIFSPIYAADKDRIHLEAHYNYEDLNTFSAWFGYNFSGGNKLSFTITPMAGVVVGNLNGLAPGLETNFDFGRFNFNSTSQYVFDFSDKQLDYYYNWTDFSYSPLDWLFFGGSLQRTRLYEGSLELQRGALLGISYRWLELSGYWYNPAHSDSYVVLAITMSIPEP
ncbi:hypothetical protein [Fulvivirga sedimenti]|uniref:DUF481 domain-containing protein n=1 Tax=Fulvivirga sedimenti TaxID=2879465 RepID=A0A9X1HQS9_9BACT|nr:hypothetical protein [Fulvivirga sedimenti]MCA6075042.1 hypothetical protein [Fulvivirga sedimenti]MCA6076219.1 hypothetical protein [Fulvivirga sedimenti]MCA6077347.1 hypothetical protein [Fulvivirga sedimenti]